jgi:hypothetical protein
MLEEYCVRSSDATIDIVYSDFSSSGSGIRDSDLITITNEIHNSDSTSDSNNESNNESNIESNNFYKKIIIFCSLILFISGLYIIIN